MATTISSLLRLTADLPAALGRVARQPQIRREADSYLAAIRNVKSIDDFIRNDRVYLFALKAFGLEEMAYGKAFIRRVLSEGVDRSDSLANRLVDPRFRELAQTFNFARYGATTTAFARTQEGTVERFHRQTLEADAGRTNEGLRLALYFQRKAPSVTTPYGLLADRALLKVTQVALGMPESTSKLSIERQAEMIERRMSISDLKSPEKLDTLLGRFAALWDVAQPASTAAISALDLTGGRASAGLSLEILGSLQNRGKGG